MVDIPDYQTLMLPVLRIAAEGDTTIPKAVERLGLEFNLSSDQMAQLLPSGGVPLINNRAHWAKTYLLKAGLLEQPSRGIFRATSKGLELLRAGPARIDNQTLLQFPEFRKFRRRDGDEPRGSRPATFANIKTDVATPPAVEMAAPDERIALAAKELDDALRDDLLNRIFQIEPIASRALFFERLVIRLLLAMGYGGGRDESAFHTGGRGDEGIDGVIHGDALGLDPVYVQAKCYDRESKIGPEKIQAFKGALDDRGATRGVFLTTARFSDAARKSGRASQKQIALIDGERLADLMIRFDVGVQTRRKLVIKKLEHSFP